MQGRALTQFNQKLCVLDEVERPSMHKLGIVWQPEKLTCSLDAVPNLLKRNEEK
jgi:hypothetical protein